MELSDGSRVGVIGGGPAGSLTSYFLLELAKRVDLKLEVDIYEPRDFSSLGPAGCNHCGGIVSESLVQMLSTEGIDLPPSVVQRGIESYVLHTDDDHVHISTPLEEKRIAALYRGGGPKGSQNGEWESFDGFLLNLACEQGANHLKSRVTEIHWENDRPMLKTNDGSEQSYDLLVGAVGVNSTGLKLFQDLGFPFRKPKTTKAYISEILLGREEVQNCFGNSMHVFLLDIPRLEFAALIPKGAYVTACMLGHEIDQELADRFLNSPEVRNCFPPGWKPMKLACKCLPRMNVGRARRFFSNRIVLVGDCGVSRLYKDGIGAAYRTAKACAITAIFHGISKHDFQSYYWPTCKRLTLDNELGTGLFMGAAVFRKLGFLRRAMLQKIRKEQKSRTRRPVLSMVMWDMFTGSASYRDILFRSLTPLFLLPLLGGCLKALSRGRVRSVPAQ
jgi:flavin-dependent dehydrogenase